MRVLPILFNTDMVRALLEDRKTVTRRAMKYMAHDVYKAACFGGRWVEEMKRENPPRSVVEWYCKEFKRPPYQPGDILYVRETWCNANKPEFEPDYYYFADTKYVEDYYPPEWKWRPSIHMPKEAARIFLRVKDVRVERLQEITEEQARAEGFYPGWKAKGAATPALTARQAFMWFWLPDVWAVDPWVWVIEFERMDKPEGWPHGKA